MLAGKAHAVHLDRAKIYVFTSDYLKAQAAQFEVLGLASTKLTEMAYLKGAERAQRYDELSQFAHLKKPKL